MSNQDNPFSVQTPEDINAQEVVDLFVDVFSDFRNVPNPGHTFLNGPRGSGKSMMFRFLEPDCQLIHTRNIELRNLAFYAVYIPIKNTDLKVTELDRLENKHASVILNEHFLTVFVAARTFASIRDRCTIPDISGQHARSLRAFIDATLMPLLITSGLKPLATPPPDGGLDTQLSWLVDLFDGMSSQVIGYLRRLSFRRTALSYKGPLCGYLDFLLPVLRELRKLTFMPSGPIYLLLDDADNLNETQTRILNSWVFCRTSSEVSLKISTQLNYKTRRTSTDQRIDSPHDFTEIDIATVYSSGKSRYANRVREIVIRRLKRYGYEATPEEFFPEYTKQEAAIRALGDAYRVAWEQEGKGHRPGDDAYRYARPDYIKSLGGPKKGSSKYRYAGFEQLVYLSSGVVRYFLEPASRMFVEAASLKDASHRIEAIGSSIQDRIVRDEAEKFMVSEFDKLSEEHSDVRIADRFSQLRNLTYGLGGAFHAILLSTRSERRVFSIAFSDTPDRDVLAVFKLGVQYGYFHESSIGNKEGTGRTRMFVLSKRLAPFFMLDPTGFSGYKFVTNAAIKEAIQKPRAFIAMIDNGGLLEDPPQLALFKRTAVEDQEEAPKP